MPLHLLRGVPFGVLNIVVGFVALVSLSGCGASDQGGPSGLSDGVWVGGDGPDTFAFQFTASGDSLAGIIHTVRDGKKTTELPVTSVSYDAPSLELFMDATGVSFEGTVVMDEGLIEGRILGPTGSVHEMDLTWSDSAAFPCLHPHPALKDGELRYLYVEPPVLDDGWDVAAPDSVGLDRGSVERAVAAFIAGQGGLVHSFLVIRHGKLAVEEYFYGYERDDLHRLASCTKSVSSLLLGVALDQGSIAGLDTPIHDFFPEDGDLRTPEWNKITLRHLLTMSMGLDWTESEAQSTHGTGPDFFREVLSHKPVREPGSQWSYVSANVNLLAGVIRQATGMHADQFAEEHLLKPLGIDRYMWDYGAVDGYRMMDGSLQLLPRDMAKIGALVLNDGIWRGRQIISEEWIRESTTAQIETAQGPEKYGYLWWLVSMGTPEGTRNVKFASGWGSQFISVFPELDMIIVTTGGNDDNGKNFAPGDVIAQYLLPGVS